MHRLRLAFGAPLALLAAARALCVFGLVVVPQAQVSLRAWRRRAGAISDRALRDRALDALVHKAANVEAAAVFATLAPRRGRRQLVELLVALQVLTDFLDTVSELPSTDPLRNGLALHRALIDALGSEGGATASYYALHDGPDDGGYVAGVVAACRAEFARLPAADAVRPFAARAAARCAAGQSYTHAALHGDVPLLEAWASGLGDGAPGYRWWEVAAAASSSVAVHALVAAAADWRTTALDAARADALYFMPVGSLTVLLDNLVDRDRDLRSGGHNYLAYYAGPEQAAGRLASITEAARAAARGLRLRRRHEAILAGVLAFYLSAPEAHTPYARVIATQVLRRAGADVWPIVWAMRVRRRIRS